MIPNQPFPQTVSIQQECTPDLAASQKILFYLLAVT